MSTVAEQFAKTRKKAGITQRKLAETSGVSLGSIRRFEQTGDVSLSSFQKLLTAIGKEDALDTIFAKFEDQKVPKQFYPLLWDVNPEEMCVHEDSRFIIARFLSKGTTEAFVWTLCTYSRAEIRDCALHSRALSAKAANYLSVRFDVPREYMAYYRMERNTWKR